MEYCHRKKLRRVLEAYKKDGKKISLADFTWLCRLLSNAMNEEERFRVIMKKCQKAELSHKGAYLAETIFEHTCLDTPFLGAILLAQERKMGTDLDYETLHLTFLLHDWPEALEGDTDYSEKTDEDDIKEEKAFNLIVSVLDEDAREYFLRAYAIAEEAGSAKKSGRNFKNVSLDAQFFCAVEVLGYISRALYEVEAGNFYFAAVLTHHQKEYDFFYKKFASIRKELDKIMDRLVELREKYKNTKYDKQ